ncbi:MAG: hypothetical protein JWO10_2283, partial [Microbacteriaceae bacterium]|nr:hypothetical protein [Microbacteriaceae bacterium]
MRLIAAIISFVIAFAMIAFGIAQRTVFAEPDNITASAVTTSAAPVTLIDSSTLRSVPGRQGIDVSGADNVFAAYGRTEDVLAWVGKASYNTLSYDPARVRLVSKLVKGEEATVPDPHNSDLWLDEYSRARGLNFTVNVPDGITVILISDGTQPAPTHVSIRWPLDNRTPWSGPLIVGGVLLLAVGIALYLWELAYLRRVRGPQRKTPKMPKVPKQKGYKQPRRPKPATTTGRRSARRMVAVVPVLLIGTLSLSGCSTDLCPEFMGGSSAST